MTIQQSNNSSHYNKLTNSSPLLSEKNRLKKACADFEAILLNQMLTSMRNTLTNDSVFGNSLGKDLYKSMYYRQISTDIAQSGSGLGIGELLYKKLEGKLDAHSTTSENGTIADDNIMKEIKE